MKLFNTISVEISAQCNRKCVFCPVAYNSRPDERMDGEGLDKIVGELSVLKYAGRVELYIYNEPTKDWEYLKAVVQALRYCVPRCTIMVATNGDYLRTPERVMELFDAGLNQLLINCYSPGLYAQRVEWFESLRIDIARGGDMYGAIGPKRKAIKLMDKSDPSQFGSGVFGLTNRAGNIQGFMPAVDKPVSRMCVRPFRILNINWLGEALVCCQDYHGKVKVGNAKGKTVTELWSSPVLNEYRRRLYSKDRSLPLCNKCDCHAGAYPFNVDVPSGPYPSENEIVDLCKE